MDNLWWADSGLFFRLACQNTHPIKSFAGPALQGLVSFWSVCESKVSVLSLSLHTCFPPPCPITMDDNVPTMSFHCTSFYCFLVYALLYPVDYFGQYVCVCMYVHVCVCEKVDLWSCVCFDTLSRVCVCVCVHVFGKCINRARCQRCTAAEVAVSLSSFSVTGN